MLRSNVKFSVSDDVVNVGERTYGRCSLVILKGNNAAHLDATTSPGFRREHQTDRD